MFYNYMLSLPIHLFVSKTFLIEYNNCITIVIILRKIVWYKFKCGKNKIDDKLHGVKTC